MDINNSVALVTGANRGLGRAFAQRLLERGARKVYATARRPEAVDLPGVEVLALDVTDPASVRAAAAGVLADDVPVWAVDANASFARPGPRLVDGVEALAGILHPDAVTEPTSPMARRVR